MTDQTTPKSMPASDASERASALEAVFVTDIDRLALLDFMDAYVDGNYTSIIVSGTPTDEQTAEAWEVIRSQFQELIATDEQRAGVLNAWDRVSTQSNINRIGRLLACAIATQSAEITNELLDDGYVLDFNADSATIDAQIKAIVADLKRFQFDLDLEQPEPAISKDKGKGITKEFFYGILAAIFEIRGSHIQAKDITAGQFCRYYKGICAESARKRREIQNAHRSKNES